MIRKTRYLVNNTHIRYAIKNNILPRLYKGRIENSKMSYSPYIKKTLNSENKISSQKP